ncbi:MAG: hypothetical protein NTZ92_00640 [Candidatus Omnitrophica bacterium]|nr:hypothetical protein [Candidatus Omnitrophota bacterium]
MMDKLLEKSVKYTFGFVLGICAVLVLLDKLSWAGGFLVGSCWAIADMIFTFNLLRIAILKEDRKKLFVFLMVKFPVLYLIGVLILVSKMFPLASLLLGLLPIFIVMGIVRLCTRNSQIL